MIESQNIRLTVGLMNVRVDRGSLFIVSTMIALFGLHSMTMGQFQITGQASAAFIKSNEGPSQFVVNDGRGTFVSRLDVFADAILSDNISLAINFRMMQDQVPHIDLFALTLHDVGFNGMTLQAGIIDIPFGNIGDRRYPKQNPFYSLSLLHEYHTTIGYEAFPIDLIYPRPQYGEGVHILDGGLYDFGMKMSVSSGIFTFEAALINGMVAMTSVYSSQGINSNSGYGKIFRLTMTPATGFTMGYSFGFGPYLSDQHILPSERVKFIDPNDFPQYIYGGDLEFSIDHVSFYGEAIYNIFRNPLYADVRSVGGSAEIKYAVTPRLFLAGRVSGLSFGLVGRYMAFGYDDAVLGFSNTEIDRLRIEVAVGFRITRDALVKFVYQWNHEYIFERANNVVVTQIVMSF